MKNLADAPDDERLRTRGTVVISRLGQVDEPDLHFFGVAEGQRRKGRINAGLYLRPHRRGRGLARLL